MLLHETWNSGAIQLVICRILLDESSRMQKSPQFHWRQKHRDTVLCSKCRSRGASPVKDWGYPRKGHNSFCGSRGQLYEAWSKKGESGRVLWAEGGLCKVLDRGSHWRSLEWRQVVRLTGPCRSGLFAFLLPQASGLVEISQLFSEEVDWLITGGSLEMDWMRRLLDTLNQDLGQSPENGKG